jgi:hypothetical protein
MQNLRMKVISWCILASSGWMGMPAHAQVDRAAVTGTLYDSSGG